MTAELLTRESLEKRTGGVWDYVSASRLNLWLKCPLAFKVRYLEGVVSPTTPSQFIGRMVHRALERHYRHRQIGSRIEAPVLIEQLSASWEAAASDECVGFENIEVENACREQTLNLVRAYLAQVPDDESHPLAVEAAIESPLVDPANGEDLGLPLVGVIDLVLAEPDGPVIADFKTAARGGEMLEITHEIQLSAYSYLFRHASPEPEGALEIRSLIKTKTPKIETHRYGHRTENHLRRLFAVIRAYLDALDRGHFPIRPSHMCGSCDFLGSHCRSWRG